jgi:hypothetical protein
MTAARPTAATALGICDRDDAFAELGCLPPEGGGQSDGC